MGLLTTDKLLKFSITTEKSPSKCNGKLTLAVGFTDNKSGFQLSIKKLKPT